MVQLLAVMAAIRLKDAQPNMILRSVFQAGLDLNNMVYQIFVKYHGDAAFWRWFVRWICGGEPDLGRLVFICLISAICTMRQEYLAGLDGFICHIRRIMILLLNGFIVTTFSNYRCGTL